MFLVIYFIIGIIMASGLYIWYTWGMSPEVREQFVDIEIILIMLFCIITWLIPTMMIGFFIYFLIKGLDNLIDKYVRK